MRRAQEPPEVEHQLADHGDAVAGVIEEIEHAVAEDHHRVDARRQAFLPATRVELGNAVDHAALVGAGVEVFGPRVAPGAPEQLRAEVIDATNFGQAPRISVVQPGANLLARAAHASPLGQRERGPVAGEEGDGLPVDNANLKLGRTAGDQTGSPGVG